MKMMSLQSGSNGNCICVEADGVRLRLDADINELRNIVFHFRRGITPKDTDRLRRFRDKLRYDRELYVKRQRPETVTATT